MYQSFASPLHVRFATKLEQISTLEGEVTAETGDAIVTGPKNECWPIPRESFLRKYQSSPGVTAGTDGQYTKRLAYVLARELNQLETIELSNGRGKLTGHIGDWCLTYGIGNQAFIRADIFAEAYRPSKSVVVRIGVERVLFFSATSVLADTEAALRTALPNTPIVLVPESAEDDSEVPPWFQVVKIKPGSDGRPIDVPTVLTLDELVSKSGSASLLSRVRHLQNRTGLSFTRERFVALWSGLFSPASESTDVALVAAQLVAVDELNAALQSGRNNDFFIGAVPDALANAANENLRDVGAVADLLAVESQKKWQHLVLAETKTIASVNNASWVAKPFAMAWLLFGNSIVTLGLLAALGLAGFSELAEGCETGDWFAWTGCSTEGWKHWVGFGAFALYIGALLVAWLRFALAKVHRYENKHQDFRLLAECLRVQYVMSAVGVTKCVADNFSADRKAESSWVLLALRSLTQAALKSNVAANAGQRRANDSHDWAMRAFVDEQAEYHETTLISRREQAIQVLSTMGRFGAALFLVCLLLLIVNVISKLFTHDAGVFSSMGQHMLLILQVAGLALWGSMRKVMDTFALEQEVQRGQIVLDALKRARVSDRLSIIQAANLFAQDQAAWHEVRRSKPVEATTGGG